MSRWAMHQDMRNALGPPARATLQPSIVEEVVADIVRRVATDEAMMPEQSNVSVIRCGREPEDEYGDDEFVEDWSIGYLTDEDSDVEAGDLPESVCLPAAKNKKVMSMMKTNGWEYDPNKFGPDPTYADLYDGPFGPSDSVMEIADDPLALLCYFMPPKLWTQIAVESNTYHTQTIPDRARVHQAQQRLSGGEVEQLGDIRRRLSNVREIEADEVLRVVALLIARMLMPIRKGIAAHWPTKHVGALPSNRFYLYMPKNRFFHIMGYLHFSNNKSPTVSIDRAWKIRPVVDVLQRTFARGFREPPVISFDEATLPSRSRYNPMRQFNKGKAHKWGTKVFVAACAKTSYCLRIEVYSGAKTHLHTPVPKDNNTGEAAVLRNMNALYPPSSKSPWRLVVTDRFYTSVKLALELLHRRMYLTGTIQTDRSGYVKGVITTKDVKTVNKKKITIPAQGTVKLAQNKRFSQVTAAMWMDRNPVHMLSRGGSRALGTAMPAPKLVRDYHRWMGGVDVHDQLRMQRYRVQLSYKTRKYYKTLFLGLLDMALVNAFIVYRHKCNVMNKPVPKHFAFLETLMEQLLAIDSPETFIQHMTTLCATQRATLAKDRTAASPARSDQGMQSSKGETTVSFDSGHRLEESPDTVDTDQGVKKRQPRAQGSRPPATFAPGKKRRRNAQPRREDTAQSEGEAAGESGSDTSAGTAGIVDTP
ncbi:unnamed protein product [Phytophthora fragariaefolia]|uniref:Unnamed protein product n=1 Tax=Phytophthora fragariaefolia TaxID=1490495 RepID=A0A9W7D2U5_9STRA|nr:unnamed protein product [Phytophthora fragariaefolia]